MNQFVGRAPRQGGNLQFSESRGVRRIKLSAGRRVRDKKGPFVPCGACGIEPSRAISKTRRAAATKSDVRNNRMQVARAKILVVLSEQILLAPGR